MGISVGTVVRRDDPKGLGRVKVRIPGILEPESGWALPVGVPGGGSKDRGLWWVPDNGAEVAVFFNQGDADDPRYMPGHWGMPNNIADVPDASDGGDPDVRVLAFGAYDVVVDTRGGSKKLEIIDKADGANLLRFKAGEGLLELGAGTKVKIDAGTLLEVLAETLIDLGGPGSQFVALAQLVRAELLKIQATLASGTAGTSPVTFAVPYLPGDVAATKVKAI